MCFKDKIILLTGGTGSFGKKFTKILLERGSPKAIRIFSRDELKQWEMEKEFSNNKKLRFFLGDIRDKERLERAMDGVDIVVHAAALKQVPACEYNPFEAIKTNILGAQNIIEAAIDHNLEKVLAISTDKAVNPVNIYGATKMCMEKIFINANAYVGSRRTKMACVRYGNVVGSRGSVIPLFKEQRKTGTITITDQRMSRFWITLDRGVDFVMKSVDLMKGGETFIPKIPSMKIIDLASLMAPGCRIKSIGIRPGEKVYESLITEDEARHTREYKDLFIIFPEGSWWNGKRIPGGKTLPDGYRYTSENNQDWLTAEQLKKVAGI